MTPQKKNPPSTPFLVFWKESSKKPERRSKQSRFSIQDFFLRASFKTRIITLGMLLAVFSICATLFLSFWMIRDLPSPSSLSQLDRFAVSSQVLDRNGKLLYEIYADQNRTPVKLSDLPAHVAQATIAIEDARFYQHHGFDFIGIARALNNMLLKQQLQGGSTITQQLVKTALLTRERTIQRKMKEAVLTIGVELRYSKEEILEMYLNHIPYGGTSWGIEVASQTFFDKPATQLTLAESAFLAGLPQAPTRYSPFGSSPELGKQRQREVLRRMVEEEFISQQEADDASQVKLAFATPKITIQAPHFSLWIKDILEEKYGIEKVARGGLRVTTSLDLDLQQAAQASLSAEIDQLEKYRVTNGAALVTKPTTGEVLAMIGSRDYFHATADGQVNVALRERQPGSSIKPLNVVTGLQSKIITPASMLLDIPTCFQVAGQPAYCPKNYDGGFRGPVQTRFYLGNSYNIPQVKLLAMNGLERFIDTARKMGITTWTDPSRYGLSLSLGGGEVRMIDMATAFGTIATQGIRVPITPILEIQDQDGTVLESVNLEEREQAIAEMTEDQSIKEKAGLFRVLNREPSYLVSHIMLDNSARAGAFGTNSQLVVRNQTVSVKTGTTNDLRDNWTIGFTPSLLTAVWVGNNDNTPMNGRVVSGVTGAAPIWNDIMSFALRDKKAEWPEKPKDIIDRQICVLTGLLPNPEAPCQTRTEFFWKGTEPTETEQLSKEVWINPQTGLPPQPQESVNGPVEGLILERKSVVSDPFTLDYCLDCTRAVDAEGKQIQERYTVNMAKFLIPETALNQDQQDKREEQQESSQERELGEQ